MRVDVGLPNFGTLTSQIEGGIAKAATRAMRASLIPTRDELRQQIISAGLGARLANTWTGRAYPDGEKNSINPGGFIWSRAPSIIAGFVAGATIRPVNGSPYLWIPTDNVPRARSRTGRQLGMSGGRMRYERRAAGALTPEECVSRFNTEFVLRPGRNGNLLAFMDLIAGRSRGVRPNTPGRRARGRVSKLTLMFTLTRQARLPKLLDLEGPAQRWTNRFDAAFGEELQQI